MPITDLTGYVWEANNSLSIDFGVSTYNINFTSNNVNYTSITLNGMQDGVINYNSTNVYNSSWTNNAYKTITITGGTDATNSTLISWLEANGTLTAPIQANTYNLTHTLTNLTKGNITLQITPDTNYTYPTSLTISNGTIVSYDNTTGVAVISGDDTTVVSGECVEQASGYSVTIEGTYGGNQNYVYVQINNDPTWYYARYDSYGFYTSSCNIPNAIQDTFDWYGENMNSIRIDNVVSIRFGTNVIKNGEPPYPSYPYDPYYSKIESTGDFANLTLSSSGSNNPRYVTNVITMTQNSEIFWLNDE